MTAICRALLVILITYSGSSLPAAPFPPEKSEAVIKQAVLRASTCIVKIETIGGRDVVDGQLTSTGPTTGVIVSEDGFIMTSSFNFAASPSSILVTVPDSNERLPAVIVARDHLKMLTLLKIDTQDLTPAIPVKLNSVRVGQWSIALGKTYNSPLPNISLGLVSALQRIDGKALQTDAKVSPANYGGPLIDIHGDVLGILVPLSPTGKGLTEGVNWYDSGIGFAIPLEDVLASLDRLKTGTDLKTGLMGVNFGTTPSFLADPIIQEVRPNSPAAKSGLQSGDRIVLLEGKSIKTVANAMQGLGKKYAGDATSLTVKRGEEILEMIVTLTDKLEPFQHGWLGVLGQRVQLGDQPGAAIRVVMPGSPADTSGLLKSDRIVRVNGQEITSYDQLREIILLMQPDRELEVVIFRAGEEQKVKVVLGSVSDEIPEELPLPVLNDSDAKPVAKAPETGDLLKTLAEHDQKYRMYVPEEYDSSGAYGLALWLSADGEPIPEQELAQWKRICRTRGMVLVMPVSENLKAWSSDDVAWLLECVKDVERDYHIDTKMTCLITGGKEPSFPWQFVFENRETFEGLYSTSFARRFRIPFNEPGYRFQVFISVSGEDQQKMAVKLQGFLKEEGFPVVYRPKQEAMSVDDFDALGRWLDGLGGL
ncbi:MAG: PDZ domain-containing protein [Planctomycetaceae bacterium]|nr:PDZ domain-containing protein [Planctomycetaceae bacterium]